MTRKPCRRFAFIEPTMERAIAIFNSPCRRRDGFTLVEVMVVSVLTAFLAVLLSACWRGFGPTATDAIARCRIAQEMNLTVNTLARDLGGNLGISGGSLDTSGGSPWESQFLDWDCSIPNTLRLCFDSPYPSSPPAAPNSPPPAVPNDPPNWQLPQTSTPPQTVISYSLRPTVVGLDPQGPVQFYALVRTVKTGPSPHDLHGGQLHHRHADSTPGRR